MVQQRLLQRLMLQRAAQRRRTQAATQVALHTNTAAITHRNSQSDEGESESQQRQCSVCLEQFQEGEELRLLPCFHKYHRACIDQWFQNSPACPMCKRSIIE